MKHISLVKITLLFFTLMLLASCGKEEVLPPDKLIGDWNVYSIAEASGSSVIWEDLKADLVDIIPTYSCMEFTASVTDQFVTQRYVIVDVDSSVCKNPVISIYSWKVDSETGYYQFSQGSNVISYLISFTNSDNRMTWVDQTSGDVTMWDRVVTAVATE